MSKGHWQYNSHIDIDVHFGFIYKIHNMLTGQEYIGKKQFKIKNSLKPLKGRVNKRIRYNESDWKTYTGSSKTLNADIEKLGIENFRFEILALCNSKGDLRYEEVQMQWECKVLSARLPNGKYKYYNGQIDAVRRKK